MKCKLFLSECVGDPNDCEACMSECWGITGGVPLKAYLRCKVPSDACKTCEFIQKCRGLNPTVEV